MSEPYIIARRDRLRALLREMGPSTTRQLQDRMLAEERATGIRPKTRTLGADWMCIPADLNYLHRHRFVEKEEMPMWRAFLWRLSPCCPTCGQGWPALDLLESP